MVKTVLSVDPELHPNDQSTTMVIVPYNHQQQMEKASISTQNISSATAANHGSSMISHELVVTIAANELRSLRASVNGFFDLAKVAARTLCEFDVDQASVKA